MMHSRLRATSPCSPARYKALPSRAAAIAWLLTVLPATSLALAADAPAAACSRPLTAAASPIGRSMMISSAGEVTGVVRDVFDLVSLRSGCKIEYIVVPRARAHHLFRAASIDLMAAVTRTPERDDAGDFVQTHQVRAMLVSMRERAPGPMTISAFISGKLTIDTIRGYSFGPAYDQLLKQPAMQTRIDSSPDPETVLRKLVAGRTSAALVFPAVLLDAAERTGVSDRLQIDELAGMEAIPVGVYLNKRMPQADRERIQRAMQSLVRDGEFEKIFRSYNREPDWALTGMSFLTSSVPGKHK
jgi:polar amino acid transport system substrate-binding protein